MEEEMRRVLLRFECAQVILLADQPIGLLTRRFTRRTLGLAPEALLALRCAGCTSDQVGGCGRAFHDVRSLCRKTRSSNRYPLIASRANGDVPTHLYEGP